MPNEERERLASREHFSLTDLEEIVAILRAPDGCPWDSVQTHKSIRNNFAEEVFEAIDGIDREDNTALCEELGDVLLHVVFHASLAESEGAFGMQEVLDGVCRKMIRRHPHVFAGRDFDPADWDRIKKTEKGESNLQDVLRSLPAALPALTRARKILGKGGEKTRPGLCPTEGDPKLEAGEKLYLICDECRRVGVDPEEALDRYLNKIIKNCTKS